MHPFLESAPDAFSALSRAWYWSVVDSNFSHSNYWRVQIVDTERRFLASLHPKATDDTRRQLLCNAMTTAFSWADRAKRRPVYVGFRNA